jgi:RNA polymerase sigma factor (sigma-70 family)
MMTGVAAADRERLAARTIPRCLYVSRRWTRNRSWAFDDAFSAALIGLITALDTFDGRGGDDAFEAYAHTIIVYTVGSSLHNVGVPRGFRRAPNKERAISPRIATIDAAGAPQLVDRDAPPVGWDLEWEESLRDMARSLPPRHADVFLARHLHADGERFEAVARRTGLSRSAAYRLHDEALAMLRDRYARRATA